MSEAPVMLNTAGEPEREAWSRRANLAEALLVMIVLLVALWGVAYPLGVVKGLRAANTASRVLMGAWLAFVLLISPWLHRDSLSSRGLGHPIGLLRRLHDRHFKGLVVAGIIAGVLTLELYSNATSATRFVFGIEPAMTIHLQQRLGGKAVLLVLCALFSLFWITCIVRYDNFGTALRAAGAILAILLPLTVIAGWMANGPKSLGTATPWILVRNCFGYVFWGAIQQLIFCSYFGTRLRKSFAPAANPQARRWKRLGVATLNGFFFGMVHMSNWLLAGFAWVLGIFLSWVFMEDRYRNLQALGFVHGILGTSIIWLFTQKADMVSITLRIGPWAMPHHWNLTTVTVTGVLLLGFCLSLFLVAMGRSRWMEAVS